jgi:anti-sigma factor RsiW
VTPSTHDDTLLSGWIDGELTPSQRSALADRMDQDPELRARLATLQALHGAWVRAADQSCFPTALPPMPAAPSPTAETPPRAILRWVALLGLALVAARAGRACAEDMLAVTLPMQLVLFAGIVLLVWRMSDSGRSAQHVALTATHR